MIEPVLTERDVAAWETWSAVCLRWAKTRLHRARVLKAAAVIQGMLLAAPHAYITWSGGKDSTALAHLCSILGVRQSMCQIDDLDYPGKREYVAGLAQAWGLAVDFVEPAHSMAERLRLEWAGEDIHSRRSTFSSDGFYDVVDRYAEERGRPGLYMGLRKEESSHRLRNRMKNGLMYRTATGEWRCCPLGDWASEDVFGYLFTHGIDPMDVYRCCADTPPGKLRMAWWVPGTSATRGQGVWLRRYWPSLYQRWLGLQPAASIYT